MDMTTTDERTQRLIAQHERIMRMVCQLTNDGKLNDVWLEASNELQTIGQLLNPDYTPEFHLEHWDRFTKEAIAAKHGLDADAMAATTGEADKITAEWEDAAINPSSVIGPIVTTPSVTTPTLMPLFDSSRKLSEQLVAAGWPKDGDLVAANRRVRYDGNTVDELAHLAYYVEYLGVSETRILSFSRAGMDTEPVEYEPNISLIGYYPGIDKRSHAYSRVKVKHGDPLPPPPEDIVLLLRAEQIAEYLRTSQRTGGWANQRHRELTAEYMVSSRKYYESWLRSAESEIIRGTKKNMPRVLKDGREKKSLAESFLAKIAEMDRTRYDGPLHYDPRYDAMVKVYENTKSMRGFLDGMQALASINPYNAAIFQDRADALWRKEKNNVVQAKPVAVIPAAAATDKGLPRLTIKQDTDTRDQSTIYVARIPDRVDRTTYDHIAREVKRLGGYYSSYKKGFLFKGTDPTDKLTEAGLADMLCALGDEVRAADMTLGDGRLQKLQGQFRKLVAMYAMAICLDRINAAYVPAIDAEFSTIGSHVEMTFDVIKHQELESCRRERMDATATTAVDLPADDAVDILDRVWTEAEHRRHTLPYVMQTMAEDARLQWENLKATIDELKKKPDTFDGTKAAYDQSIVAQLNPLVKQRETAYRTYTGLRNKWSFQADTPDDLQATVWREQARLFREWSGRLTPEAIDVRLQDLDKQMREAAAYEHYPTPIAIVDSMLEYANITDGDRVLEPSAGEGNIAGRILERHPGAQLHVVEYDEILSDILTLKGFTVVGSDFLQYTPAVPYDAIVMNPPFDRGVDIEHVYHAFKMLKPGGRLVAITSAAAIDGGDEANYAFRDFINERGSYRLLSAKDYMGPAGRLTNGRSITISVGIVSVTRAANDTFGQETKIVVGTAGSGQKIYDTQGSALYEIESVTEDANGKTVTLARNMATNVTRTFNGIIKVGSGRFIDMTDEQANAVLERMSTMDTAKRDATGKIALPKAPKVGPDGEAGLKPMRIVTSRPELMPAPPEAILYSKRIANNVTLTPGQLEGVNRALIALEGPTRSFMLADGTGFGKTLQQLVVAATVVDQHKKPALIFTKAPSIIESSFYPDARKLKINTPDAQNKADRITFKGSDAAGMSIKRVASFPQIAGKALDQNAIYIASYHVFGAWKGDATERKKMKDHYDNVVKLMREKANKDKQAVSSNSYYSEDEKKRIKRKIEEEFQTSPANVKYLELKAAWIKVNTDFFSEIGEKFSIVISDEAHAYKNYNPDDINDGALQAYRGMVLYQYAERGMYCTATAIDKVEHIRYLKPLGIYKTEAQYMRMMAKMGFVWNDPTYIGSTMVRGGGFSMDQRIPPEYVLTNISRLFENLTMAGTMVKRELSLDNFEAHNVMIGGQGAPPEEEIAVKQATNVLGIIDQKLRDEKKCKAGIINEKKWALEPYKVQKVIEITKRELLEGRQVVIFASLVNDSGPSYPTQGKGDGKCKAVDKPSTVNVLKRELAALFGEDQIGFVTGDRKSDEETLGDNAEIMPESFESEMSYVDEAHERSFYGQTAEITGLSDGTLADKTQRQRVDDIRAFQEGRKRILIATTEAGGTGISLDDTVGNAPRTVIIMTAPFSSVEVVQMLGRINRAQTKSRQRAYFLWVNVPIDKRLRDIIASKLKVLGAAVQGEVKKVSVEEVEFASTENAQENYDKHNVDKDGKLREHSLYHLQVIEGIKMPSRKPFTLTHKSQLSTEIEPDGQSRQRYAPIRLIPTVASGGRAMLREWMEQNQDIVGRYRMELESDRYSGSYLTARFNPELWNYLLNWMKPENTRFVLNDLPMFVEGDRIKAATDILEADAAAGAEGTVTRVWERRIRQLDVETGKPVKNEAGEQVWKYQYDYMVEFDNGERANNLENWEIVAAVDKQSNDGEERLSGLASAPAALSDTVSATRAATAPQTAKKPTVASLADRISALEEDMRNRVRGHHRES